MTAPNLVDSDVVKGFVYTQFLNFPHVKVIRNAANSNNVIKINQMRISNWQPGMSWNERSLLDVWILRGGVKYYLFKSLAVDGHADDGYEFSLLESTVYLEEGDEVWACITDSDIAQATTGPYAMLTINYEVITDQSTLVYEDKKTEARTIPEYDESGIYSEQFYITHWNDPNTTFNYTITSPNLSSADFVGTWGGIVPSSFPYAGQYTTNGQGYAILQFNFTEDASTGEGDESMSIEGTDFYMPNIIIKDTSQGLSNIYVQGMQSRYGGNIGEIRWYIVDSSLSVVHTLTNFSNGTYNSSGGGYTNSGYRNSWTDTNLNYKNQTVQVQGGATYYLVIAHRRWSSYNGDYAVDGITINVIGGNQYYYSIETNTISGWQISMSSGSTPISSASFSQASTYYQEGWVLRSGNTPSYSTGPSTGGDGSYYLYTETSWNNNVDRIYYLKSPAIIT